jgi:hypothetical protein
MLHGPFYIDDRPKFPTVFDLDVSDGIAAGGVAYGYSVSPL